MSLAKYFLEQGQEAVPIFVSHSISSAACGMGEKFTPGEVLEKTVSETPSQADEHTTELPGGRGNGFT